MVVSYFQESAALIRETTNLKNVIVISEELEETFFVILEPDLFYHTQQPLQPNHIQPEQALEPSPTFLN